MGSIPRGVLRQMAGGGSQRPKERWEPSTIKSSAIRLYRYEVSLDVNGVTTIEKRLCNVRELHFNGKGVAPTDCTGGSTCKKCRDAALMEAQGTEEALEKARQMQPTTSPEFVVVPIEEPTRFRTFSARFSAFQGILLELAIAGGWRSSDYPDGKAWEEGCETGPLFDKCVDAGCEKVCGPKGQDLILTPKAKGKGFTWSVRRMPDGNNVLPFPEDSKVLNPEEVQARIKAAVEKKAGLKEGDD